MTPRDLFWRAVHRGNYAHAMTFIRAVYEAKEPYLVAAKHINSSVMLLGVATFGPLHAAAGVDWVNDTGVPGPQSWRLAGTEPK